jgi:hypothetical protein
VRIAAAIGAGVWVTPRGALGVAFVGIGFATLDAGLRLFAEPTGAKLSAGRPSIAAGLPTL